MKKTIQVIGGILLVGVALLFFVNSNSSTEEKLVIDEEPKLSVVASFYPLGEFARQVGGDRVEVTTLTPPGASPHDFEPTPRDIATIQGAKVFVFNGAGLEPWAEKIEPELVEKGVVVVHITEDFDLLKADEDHGHEEENTDEHEGEEMHEEDGEEHAEEGGLDPHIWLDPSLAKREVEIIRDTLSRVDPENATFYETNASKYIAELEALDSSFSSGLAQCKTRDIVASHGAFGYLAKKYNINVINIAGMSPEEEPTPKRMAEIAELIKEKEITHIFFETLVSPALAETLAAEVGAKTLVVNPMEGLTEEELSSGENYVSVMRQNLENIRTALSCTST